LLEHPFTGIGLDMPTTTSAPHAERSAMGRRKRCSTKLHAIQRELVVRPISKAKMEQAKSNADESLASSKLDALRERLRAAAAPGAFGQTGTSDPLVFAALRLADGSLFYASEIFAKETLIYGFRVNREEHVAEWHLVEVGRELGRDLDLLWQGKPTGLRRLLIDEHGLTLNAPCFF
jgi:hypothetical protein